MLRNFVKRTSDYFSLQCLQLQVQALDLASCSSTSQYYYYLNVLSIPKRSLQNGSRLRSRSRSKLDLELRSFNNIIDKNRSRSRSSIRMSSTWNTQHSNFSESDDLEVSRMGRFLVVGLGNYIYPSTRHSVGMMAVDSLMCRLGSRWEKSRVCGGFLGKSSITKEDGTVTAQLFLFKPNILMNINGKSVLKAAKHLDITADKIYLIHDELDKGVGKCGIKDGGSARGHKGVISCYDCLRPSHLWPKSNNGREFKGMTRLLIGIGRPTNQAEIVSYVLSRFHDEESEKIGMAINNGLDLLLKHVTSRITT